MQHAINAGLRTAKGDAVALMDGDLQDPPAVIPEMIKEWRKGAQVVTAVRRSRKESRKILALTMFAHEFLFSFRALLCSSCIHHGILRCCR